MFYLSKKEKSFLEKNPLDKVFGDKQLFSLASWDELFCTGRLNVERFIAKLRSLENLYKNKAKNENISKKVRSKSWIKKTQISRLRCFLKKVKVELLSLPILPGLRNQDSFNLREEIIFFNLGYTCNGLILKVKKDYVIIDDGNRVRKFSIQDPNIMKKADYNDLLLQENYNFLALWLRNAKEINPNFYSLVFCY